MIKSFIQSIPIITISSRRGMQSALTIHTTAAFTAMTIISITAIVTAASTLIVRADGGISDWFLTVDSGKTMILLVLLLG